MYSEMYLKIDSNINLERGPDTSSGYGGDGRKEMAPTSGRVVSIMQGDLVCSKIV